MFLASPDETPYDLRWRMFGISVRVHPLFWVIAAVLTWHFTASGVQYLLLGIACVFVSILIHEMGHVLVGKLFGSDGHIILYAFGGLAVGSSNLRNRAQRVAVLLAGPFAQFLIFGLIWALLYIKLDFPLNFSIGPFYWFGLALPLLPLPLPVILAVECLLYINMIWPILNLLPIWPLDGGQITRELAGVASPRNGTRIALQISIGVSAILALHALLAWQTERGIIPYLDRPFHAIFFALFAITGIQALQAENERERWIDDHTYHDDGRW